MLYCSLKQTSCRKTPPNESREPLFFLLFHIQNLVKKLLPWESIVITFSAGMFSAVGFGLFISVFGLISDQMHMFLNLTQCLLLILSGANFLVSQLPNIFQKLSYVLPLTSGISATQTMLAQASAKLLIQLVLGEVNQAFGYKKGRNRIVLGCE